VLAGSAAAPWSGYRCLKAMPRDTLVTGTTTVTTSPAMFWIEAGVHASTATFGRLAHHRAGTTAAVRLPG
jgi:hypothetical protein